MQHIYLAAPLFTKAEQMFNEKVYEFLIKQGHQVFLPQQSCQGKQGQDIYLNCLQGLQSAFVVIAILDGADADSGTCWECGYGVARGIPVIAVRTDFRGTGDIKGFNAMLYYSASFVVQGENFLEDIANTIDHIIDSPKSL